MAESSPSFPIIREAVASFPDREHFHRAAPGGGGALMGAVRGFAARTDRDAHSRRSGRPACACPRPPAADGRAQHLSATSARCLGEPVAENLLGRKSAFLEPRPNRVGRLAVLPKIRCSGLGSC